MFKKGQSGNPGGRVKMPEELKKARRMNTVACQEIMDRLIKMPLSKIKELMQNPESTAFELMLGKIVAEAIAKGDHMRLSFILDRLIGKVTDKVVVDAPKPLIMKLIGEDAVLAIGVTENGDE